MTREQIDQASFRRLLTQNVVLPLLLGIVSSAIFVGMIFFLNGASSWVEHTDQVIGQANKIEKMMVDAETGLRGFTITHQDEFLEPYKNAIDDFPHELQALKDVVGDNPIQAARIDSIAQLYQRWQEHARQVIDLSRRNKSAAEDLIVHAAGKKIMDEERSILNDFVDTEDALRTERVTGANQITHIMLIVVIGLGLLIGVIIALLGRRQLLLLSTTYEKTILIQQEQNTILERQQWVDTGRTELGTRMLGERKMADLTEQLINYTASYLHASVGAVYVTNDQQTYECSSTYAVPSASETHKIKFRSGETQLGQAVKENRVLQMETAPAHLRVSSSFVDTPVQHVLIVPVSANNAVVGVIELGFQKDVEERILKFFADAADSIGLAINSARYRERLEKLLAEVQNQAEELQSQQEELRVGNEELEEQTKLLKDAQSRLESQHAELEQTNSQLEEQAQTLEHQKDVLSLKNDELKDTQGELERKADELQRASQYKSEFLANMSHELRTPLNSSLILAKLLADNKDKNLTDKQVEFAQQIMSSGNDLLALINDILDLSKVESGKLEINPEELKIQTVVTAMERVFAPIAREKKLQFVLEIDPAVPETLTTDMQRLEQILRNLLSNAFKFTSKGEVGLKVSAVESHGEMQLVFDVSDTGIGIQQSQQEVIFEAFRQADGTTNRKYGGTGLGLSISRDLARLLGGSIRVESQPQQGSHFLLSLPVHFKGERTEVKADLPVLRQRKVTSSSTPVATSVKPRENVSYPQVISDDRGQIADQDRLILVIEDDGVFAKILLDLAHELQFKCIAAGSATEALDWIQRRKINAIVLDINLPDHSGLLVLDSLKQNPQTRHIPVHVISGHDFSQQALQMGAIGYMLKPVKREQLSSAFAKLEATMNQNFKRVLIVEDDPVQRQAIERLIEDSRVESVGVTLGQEALDKLRTEKFDCMIMDLSLPDMSGFTLLDRMADDETAVLPPVIVYTGHDLNREEEELLRRHSQTVIIKGAKSPDRLLNEVTLFLHKVESQLGPERQKMLEHLRNREKIFENKVIMVADDDIRNVFALTSALEQKGARIVIARDGEEAVRKLKEELHVDMVLMDIMMPVMNGYEAMTAIRQNKEFEKLPIIALTAKAMKDDRDLCLNAGANDYLAKPVDIEKLLSLIRIWISYGEHR